MKQKSNIKLITDFMDLGPVNQLLVMDAVMKQVMNIIETPKAEIVEVMKGCFIAPESWYNAAKLFKTLYESNYNHIIPVDKQSEEA